MAAVGAFAGLEVLRRRARLLERALVVLAVERREDQRDRKRQIARPEQRGVQIGIERGQLLGRRLFRLLDVGPVPLDGTILSVAGQGTDRSQRIGSRVPGRCQVMISRACPISGSFPASRCSGSGPACARSRRSTAPTRPSTALRAGADGAARADCRRRGRSRDAGGVDRSVRAGRAGTPGARLAAAGDQRHRRRDSHQPRARAAGGRRRSRGVSAIARGYSNLEYDLATGERGSRTVHAESLLTTLTGAEAAIVVNNNAAATMLILAGLAAGREVVISRGELVEIGGGFRVPDVMRQSGAIAARGRHHQPHARHRLHGRGVAGAPRCSCACIRRTSASRASPSGRRSTIWSPRRARCSVPVVEDIGSGCLVDDLAGRAVGAGVDRRGRRPGLLQRRQAARRPAGGHHRRQARRWSIGCARIR